MVNWTLLASRARALPCIAHDPEVRVRDFGTSGHHRTQRLQHRHRPAEADYEVNVFGWPPPVTLTGTARSPGELVLALAVKIIGGGPGA